MIEFNEWKNLLQKSGARITKPREAILRVITSCKQPLTPQEIFESARMEARNLGLVTVYRTITKLESLGLIVRIHGQDQCQTVFRKASGHQHLLTCTECGKSVYFDGLSAEHEFQKIGQQNHFNISGHLLQLFGKCNTCQEKKDKNE